MRYQFATLNRLKSGQYFMFPNGTTINICVMANRDTMIFQNVITKRCTRMNIIPTGAKLFPLRYARIVDNVFESYYQTRQELEDLPF